MGALTSSGGTQTNDIEPVPERVRWFLRTKRAGDVSAYHAGGEDVSLTTCPALAHGLWGQAKFSDVEAAPFASLVSQ